MSETNETPVKKANIIKNSDKITHKETILVEDQRDNVFKPINKLKDPLQKSKIASELLEEVRMNATPSPEVKMLKGILGTDKVIRILKVK